MAAILGLNAKLYRNTGTNASPSWTLIDNVRDLAVNLETGTADVSTRGTGGWRAMLATLKQGTITFGMVYDQTDTNFAALQDAWFANTQIQFAVADGAIATSGTEYLKMFCSITRFNITQNLEEGVLVDVELQNTFYKESGSLVNPSWNTVS